jgi:hypothetical protein
MSSTEFDNTIHSVDSVVRTDGTVFGVGYGCTGERDTFTGAKGRVTFTGEILSIMVGQYDADGDTMAIANIRDGKTGRVFLANVEHITRYM